MFAARGIAICLSVFAILYAALSVAVILTWRHLGFYKRRLSPRRSANLLFLWRMFPLAAAAGATLFLAVPSFVLLEPRTIHEPIGALPLGLGIGALMILVGGGANALLSLARASQAIARWQSGGVPVELSGSVPFLRVSQSLPAPVTAGILWPKVLLSREAEHLLTPQELTTSLRHEWAHVRRYDNLRKLILRLVAFPGMAELETFWREFSEMAADDAAVSSASEALDLAAALIKISRSRPLQAPGELITALVHSPAASVNARVERLMTWGERAQFPTRRFAPWYSAAAALAMVGGVALIYGQLLVMVHAATEWLVR